MREQLSAIIRICIQLELQMSLSVLGFEVLKLELEHFIDYFSVFLAAWHVSSRSNSFSTLASSIHICTWEGFFKLKYKHI